MYGNSTIIIYGTLLINNVLYVNNIGYNIVVIMTTINKSYCSVVAL